MAAKRNILFIINPVSGTSGKDSLPGLIRRTIDAGRFDCAIAETAYAGQAATMASRAKDEADVIVAVGGDGTVNEVARATAGSRAALGIIPCGSGNGLARHLMLPMDPRRAVETINRCVTRRLDYGIINGRPFFCTCGMGFDAFISHKFAEAGRRGLVTYVEKVFREGMRYKPEKYVLEEPGGRRVEAEAFLISCANASQYGNNAYIAPQASMSDGMLDIIIMEPFDLLDAPRVVMDMMNKTLDKSPKIRTLRTGGITIHRQKPGYIHYDGEPAMEDADVDIRVVREGISMIVNPDADKSRRKPNAIQSTFSDIFNDLGSARDEIIRQAQHMQDTLRRFRPFGDD